MSPNRLTTLTEWGRILAPYPFGPVFTPQTVEPQPKNRNAKPDHQNPHFLQSPPSFWFMFWFQGGLTHVPDDVIKPIQKVDSSEKHGFL